MERRLAAIVAADVVNYSILIAQNEFGTLGELSRLKDEVFAPAITQYNGRIVRLMGDGSLLAFDSALNAVKFAVDVQRVMAERKTAISSDVPIDFRMGANLGDIVHEKNDIHGEGINVAVRLEELAPPGGICLSDSIYMQTKNALRENLLPIGERHLKNIAEPIRVWKWQPPGAATAHAAASNAANTLRHLHGRQILDPKVTALLVDLHMRSAKLALSDAFDDMLDQPEGGRQMSLQDIHSTIGDRLTTASELLFPVSVERSSNAAKPGRRRREPQALGDFLTEAFDGADMFFAFSMLRRIQAILRSNATQTRKRAAFMRLAHEFLKEPKVPEVKEAIRFAFVDP